MGQPPFFKTNFNNFRSFDQVFVLFDVFPPVNRKEQNMGGKGESRHYFQ